MKSTLIVISVMTVFAALCVAQDDAAYKTAMKAVNASAGGRGAPLRAAITAKDTAAAAAEGGKVAAAFDTILAYWTAKKTDDAIKLATTARDAAKALAAATDSDSQTASLKTLQGTCGQCHSAHRESVGPGQFNIK